MNYTQWAAGLYWITTWTGVAVGLYAAKLSGKSAKVSPDPFRDGVVESGEPACANAQLTAGILRASIEASRLSSKAARWTASAVLLGLAAAMFDHIH